MRIGLLGGTLDPIHFGHLRSAEEIREALELDEVWFVPAALPPHKEYESITPFAHRLGMLKPALATAKSFKTVPIEERRPGPSFSIDTLRELREMHGREVEFFFILGSDAFLDIETWKDYEYLTDYACLVVMERGHGDSSKIREVISRAFPHHHIQDEKDVYIAMDRGAIHLCSVTHLAISGTDIRRRASSGLSLRFLVPEAVRRYIGENNLYNQSTGDLPAPPKDLKDKGMSPEDLAQEIALEIEKNKGENIVTLDIKGRSALADFFIISHGRSTKHVQGIANRIRRDLRKKKIKCKGIEGEREGNWILMDYGDVVVHLFYEPVRGIYDLEGLWGQEELGNLAI